MNDTQDDMVDLAVRRALGKELRQARENAGFTRAELVALLPSKIHVQTLAMYERGERACSVERFVEICQAMDTFSPDLLSWALQKAEKAEATVQIDLHAVANDNRAELSQLRGWARKKLDDGDDDGFGIVRLDRAVINEMARLFDLSQSDFMKYLIMFTPQPSHRSKPKTSARAEEETT